mmetsp:Transcript_1376/g.3697  ORF Transcript_1376/g.3697 Transcript_1376/m.3697 type:complete len:390 (-) Transcript_1376:252-1421(-)|eukprot:CAMPEP_0194527354 /NCGR_PEP_ID=MMETSP0253-20130528/63435_1 /TAXON_ID=2966 /ORGANISM="Noctiluca scintillans" /LENGTH=389 /DNA_ID=CAMNT_0039372285 /DNA_START=59 /DNA_END=1228 /DNA_ORIENTATION=-
MGNVQGEPQETFHARYTIGQQLGKGSQGKVHLCEDKVTGEVRAVKVLDRQKRVSCRAYQREVDLAGMKLSASVIQVLGAYMDSANYYIVMEKFEGQLMKAMKRMARDAGAETSAEWTPCISDAALQNIMRQGLSGIVHLHQCGIVHRDVKASNFLVDRLDLNDLDCRVVVADLGLAVQLAQDKALSAQVGTRKYWAPEVYDQRYWHSVDVFALGVLLFLLSRGAYPFLSEKETRSCDTFASGLAPDGLANDTLTRFLTKDPTERPHPVYFLTTDAWLATCTETTDTQSAQGVLAHKSHSESSRTFGDSSLDGHTHVSQMRHPRSRAEAQARTSMFERNWFLCASEYCQPECLPEWADPRNETEVIVGVGQVAYQGREADFQGDASDYEI